MHGFDEFFGNLYHLNAEEEPENPDYPKDPALQAELRAARRDSLRGDSDVDDTAEDPRFGPVGKQKIEDTGPLTKKRMETIDDEFLDAADGFIDRANRDDKPFFVWFNSTPHAHLDPSRRRESQGKTGLGIYPDGMVEHDGHVGAAAQAARRPRHRRQHHRHVLDRQRRRGDDLARRRHDAVPRREEHQLGRRLSACPAMVRWPGVIKPGTIINDIVAHEDWLPTLAGRGGEQPDIKAASCSTGCEPATRPSRCISTATTSANCWQARHEQAPRHEFFYWTDDGDLAACATTTGRWSSWSSAATASRSGRSRSSRCGSRS